MHLTLNAEWERFRWGPITHAPSLLDGDGGFPRTIEDLWDHADLDEVRRELRAQVERAILWGFDVSHLDDHMGVLQQRPEFFDVMLDLAVEFQLPVRLLGQSSERAVGLPVPDAGRRGRGPVPRPPDRQPGTERPGHVRRASSARSGPASPSSSSTPPSTPPSCGRPRPTGAPGSTTTRWPPPPTGSSPRWTRPARSASATGPCGTSSGRAEAQNSVDAATWETRSRYSALCVHGSTSSRTPLEPLILRRPRMKPTCRSRSPLAICMASA